MSPAVLDLIFTVAASGALLSLLLIAALILPWSESELEDAEAAFRALFAPGRAPAMLRARRTHRGAHPSWFATNHHR